MHVPILILFLSKQITFIQFWVMLWSSGCQSMNLYQQEVQFTGESGLGPHLTRMEYNSLRRWEVCATELYMSAQKELDWALLQVCTFIALCFFQDILVWQPLYLVLIFSGTNYKCGPALRRPYWRTTIINNIYLIQL